MAKNNPGEGPYSRSVPTPYDRSVDDAGNPVQGPYQIYDKVENLHVEPGSKPIPVGTSRRRG